MSSDRLSSLQQRVSLYLGSLYPVPWAFLSPLTLVDLSLSPVGDPSRGEAPRVLSFPQPRQTAPGSGVHRRLCPGLQPRQWRMHRHVQWSQVGCLMSQLWWTRNETCLRGNGKVAAPLVGENLFIEAPNTSCRICSRTHRKPFSNCLKRIVFLYYHIIMIVTAIVCLAGFLWLQ